MNKLQETFAWIVGAILIIVGIAGFFVVDELIGFGVNLTHNLVHIVTGLVFFYGAWKGPAAKFNLWIGIVYIVVALVGFIPGALDFLNVDLEDNILHLVIGVVSACIGGFCQKKYHSGMSHSSRPSGGKKSMKSSM